MPRYKIIQERDAIIRFEAEIEAATPAAALDRARHWNCPWIETGRHQLDRADMAVYDLSGAELIAAREVWS